MQPQPEEVPASSPPPVPPDQGEVFSAITITPDGEVIFENLAADLVDVAHTLNPSQPDIQVRKQLLDRMRAATEGEGAD